MRPTAVAVATLLALAFMAVAVGPVSAQVVSPLQQGHYAPGIMNVRDFATPPPGLFVMWYNWFAWSDTYVDRNGNELSSLNLSEIDPGYPDVDIDISGSGWATIPVVTWASNIKILGGTYLAAIAPNFLVTDYRTVLVPDVPDPEPVVAEGDNGGISDLLVQPFGLSWAFGRFSNATVSDEELAEMGLQPFRRFNITTAYSFIAPTGRYETGADDNLGLGFWTHQFQGFGYFYPFEYQGTALMACLTYEINGKLNGEDLWPGNRLSFEWGISHYFTERLEATVQGAHNWQVTDDYGNDAYWDASLHDKRSTVLFGAGYWAWNQRLQVSAKYGFDFAMRQRFKNDNLMINFIYLTDVLTGR